MNDIWAQYQEQERNSRKEAQHAFFLVDCDDGVKNPAENRKEKTEKTSYHFIDACVEAAM